MSDFIQVDDAFYVHASSSRVDDRTHVLKCDETFAVFDRRGDIHPHGRGHQGLYHRGTRFLNRLELTLAGSTPLLLSSATKVDSSELVVDAANPDIVREGGARLPANHLHVCRSTLLSRDGCHQQFVVRSYAGAAVDVAITIHHDADFRDVFEVRGMSRQRRGEMLEPELGSRHVSLRYRGLDGVVRTSRLEFDAAPQRLTATAATFACHLAPHEEVRYQVVCRCFVGAGAPGRGDQPMPDYRHVLATQLARLRGLGAHLARLRCSDAACNAWLERSEADLQMMLAETPQGPFPHAGVPWYATVFGRDGLLTAFECLLVAPGIARAVLGHLAALQATTHDEARDAQPGKILHEVRDGEMAALGEIPFGRYYGSVDATPLFVLLAASYWRRTADTAFLRDVWPAIEGALAWCDASSTRGFVRYQRCSPTGLVHQGWKDSHDAVFHADGTPAAGPIALCEVQGYVHAAQVAAADVADALGHAGRARELRDAAERLRVAFERAFWCEDIGTYALAIDGADRPCRVRTSNPGHCLFCGIVAPERAARVVATLLADDSWTGFGVRTVSAREVRFNPMAYHNGSVWPHDNALIAWGMARHGFRAEARMVLSALRDASSMLDQHRLPELFCGMPRRPHEGPTLYPVACSPQAWAVAAVFLLLQASLGIEVDAVGGQVRITEPALPDWLDDVTLTDLQIGTERFDLRFSRRGGRDGAVDVVVLRGDERRVVVRA